MNRFFPSLMLKRGVRLSVTLFASSLIGVGHADDAPFGVPISPNAHLYSYFVINGMARGAFMLGKLRQKDMPTLIQIDEVTRKAVLHNMNTQTIRSDFQADQVLARYLELIPR